MSTARRVVQLQSFESEAFVVAKTQISDSFQQFSYISKKECLAKVSNLKNKYCKFGLEDLNLQIMLMLFSLLKILISEGKELKQEEMHGIYYLQFATKHFDKGVLQTEFSRSSSAIGNRKDGIVYICMVAKTNYSRPC